MPVQTYSVQTTAGVVASSSGAGWFPFGFRARTVRVDNMGTVPIWVKLDTTATGSTADVQVHSCSPFNWQQFQFGDALRVRQVTLFATSTSASQATVTAVGQ